MGHGAIDYFADASSRPKVTISKPFWLGRHEVTHGQWRALMGSDLQGAANTVFNDRTLYSDGKEEARTLDMHGGKIARGTSAEVLLGDTGDAVAMYLARSTKARWKFSARATRRRSIPWPEFQ